MHRRAATTASLVAALLCLGGAGGALSGCAGDPAGDKVPIGAACSAGDRCAAGSICYEGLCRAVCNQSGQCTEDGQTCVDGLGYDGQGGSCRSAADCVTPPGPEPSCFDASCPDGTCVYTPRPTAVCAPLSCSDGTIANQRLCGPTGACPSAGATSCDGYACADATTCRTSCDLPGDCVTGYTCDAGHVCTSSTAASLGQCCYDPAACPGIPCATSLHCGNAQTPAVYVCCASGDTCCAGPADCAASGYACNSATYACRTNCATDDDAKCAAGLHCFSGDDRCYSSALGSPCDNAGECASGFCDGVCAANTGLGNGAVCTTGGQCSSGNCSEDYDSATRYCAPSGQCADNSTAYPIDHVLCAGQTSLRRCAAAGDWSDLETNPQPTAALCNAGGGAATGIDPAATCTSGVGGGFANLGCQSCSPFVAASATACYTTCAPDNNARCWPGLHCYSGDGQCYTDADGSPCDDSGECAIGICDSDKCSCPFIFAYRAGAWHYVTDDAGNPLGMPVKHALRKGLTAYFGPHYIVLGQLDRDSDGLLRVKLRETLHEIDYVDELKLVAVDHPIGTEIVASSAHHRIEDRRRYPPQIVTIRAPIAPRAATDWLGRDVLAKARAADGVPVPSDPARPQFYTFDFGPIAEPRHARLVLDAWSMFGREFISAEQTRGFLAVPDATGQFVRVRDIGFPQGDAKRLVIDLAGIFLGPDQRLRVHTGTGPGARARWTIDRAALDTTPPAGARVRELTAVYASLGHKGGLTYEGADFDQRIRAVDDQLGTQPCHLGQGDFTRLGQVTDLVAREDNQFVVMQHGDELVVAFADDTPPPAGMVRSWALRSTLFYKQFYRDKHVEPLPFWGMTADPPSPEDVAPGGVEQRRYRTTYNTRRYDPRTLVELGARPAGATTTLLLEVEDHSGLWSAEVLAMLGETLRARYRAVSADALVAPPPAAAGAGLTCADQACRTRLGTDLGAQRVLSAVVTGIGDRCAVSLRVDDVASRAVERVLTVDARCAAEDLARALEEGVERVAERPVIGFIPR